MKDSNPKKEEVLFFKITKEHNRYVFHYGEEIDRCELYGLLKPYVDVLESVLHRHVYKQHFEETETF